MSVEVENQAFHQGAADRRNGISKRQSAKAYSRGPMALTDAWRACREGWDAMDTYLLMAEIDKYVTEGEKEAARVSR